MGHRSRDRRWYPDVRDLPGGRVEPGEDEPAALTRELREEVEPGSTALPGE
jgi:8-oxo-dGTP diphosphatase